MSGAMKNLQMQSSPLAVVKTRHGHQAAARSHQMANELAIAPIMARAVERHCKDKRDGRTDRYSFHRVNFGEEAAAAPAPEAATARQRRRPRQRQRRRRRRQARQVVHTLPDQAVTRTAAKRITATRTMGRRDEVGSVVHVMGIHIIEVLQTTGTGQDQRLRLELRTACQDRPMQSALRQRKFVRRLRRSDSVEKRTCKLSLIRPQVYDGPSGSSSCSRPTPRDSSCSCGSGGST